MFSQSGYVQSIGVSIGIERVFAIMEKKAEELGALQATNIQVTFWCNADQSELLT